MDKRYLGDSVYINEENNMLKLYLNNGYEDHTEIFLEDFVAKELAKYIQEWLEQ